MELLQCHRGMRSSRARTISVCTGALRAEPLLIVHRTPLALNEQTHKADAIGSRSGSAEQPADPSVPIQPLPETRSQIKQYQKGF